MIIVIMGEFEIRKINYYRLTGERYSCKCRTEADCSSLEGNNGQRSAEKKKITK